MKNHKFNYHILDDVIFDEAFQFAKDVFPLHRSISGSGINNAFKRLKKEIGGILHQYPTGSYVLDWEIPQEWECCKLMINKLTNDGKLGEMVFTLDHPLRVASHSIGFKGILSGSELLKHFVISEKYPDNLTHRYLYYENNWLITGKVSEYKSIDLEAKYFIDLDCRKYPGMLKVHEKRVGPDNAPVIFFLSHICHPAQFNDGLIGVLLNVYLYKYINQYQSNLKNCYSFLAMPETIGSHAYCSEPKNLKNSLFAIFCEMVALDQPLHIQKSKLSEDYVNQLIYVAINEVGLSARFSEFRKVIRNDEKVFNAPGINIPSASITRALGPGKENHPFKGYHTDLDSINNSDISKLKEVIILYQVLIFIIENDFKVKRCFSGLPMLSRHNLFVDPLEDRNGYDLRESLIYELENEKKISELAINVSASFNDIFDILLSWEKHGLVKLFKK